MTRIGSLFTGYGGLDLAAQEVLGGEAVWHCDIKPAAVRFLEHRHPDVPNLGDVTSINPCDVAPIDALTFGWPCQPHSSAGKRLGEKDPRALWPEVARLVAALRPAVLLGENVARVTSNGELRRVVRALAEIGYVGSYRTLRASDVGAPHRRDRLFLVAFDAAAYAGREARRLARHTERGDSAGTSGVGAPEPGRRSDGAGLTLLPTPAVADARNTRNATAGRTPENDRHHSARWGKYAEAIARWERLLGRSAPEPTHPGTRTDRDQLAPAFVEWMMGLPAGWVTDVPGLPRLQQLSMLGDGVVPQQAAAAYRELLAELAGERAA